MTPRTRQSASNRSGKRSVVSARRIRKPDAIALIPADAIKEWAVACLVALRVRSRDAEQIAASLVQTSLWGIDSHGIARLGHYYSRLTAGSIEARPKIVVKRTGPCTAQVDGGHGHGIVICHRAMAEAIALAKKNGIGSWASPIQLTVARRDCTAGRPRVPV